MLVTRKINNQQSTTTLQHPWLVTTAYDKQRGWTLLFVCYCAVLCWKSPIDDSRCFSDSGATGWSFCDKSSFARCDAWFFSRLTMNYFQCEYSGLSLSLVAVQLVSRLSSSTTCRRKRNAGAMNSTRIWTWAMMRITQKIPPLQKVQCKKHRPKF